MLKVNWTDSYVYLQVASHTQQHNTATIILKVLETLCLKVKVESTFPTAKDLDTQFSLYLICAKDAPWNDMLPSDLIKLAKNNNVIVYNANNDSICEQLLLLANIKGVFYQDDTPDVLLKGVSKILHNELWFKRGAICDAFSNLLALQSSQQPSNEHDDVLEKLTNRERTIIRLISQGAQNKDVAEQLHISNHTVKTHLYSAFRKTKARNRIELVNWAQQFLPVLVKNGIDITNQN